MGPVRWKEQDPPCLHVLGSRALTPALGLSFLSWKVLVVTGSASWVLRRFGAGSLRCSKPGTCSRSLQMRDHVYQNSYFSICQMRRLRPREVEPLAQNHTAGVSGGTKVHPSLSPWYSASPGTWSISIFAPPAGHLCPPRSNFRKVELLGQGVCGFKL